MLHQDYQPFAPKQNCPDTWAKGTHYTKDANLLLVTLKDMAHFSYIAVYVGHSNLACLGD